MCLVPDVAGNPVSAEDGHLGRYPACVLDNVLMCGITVYYTKLSTHSVYDGVKVHHKIDPKCYIIFHLVLLILVYFISLSGIINILIKGLSIILLFLNKVMLYKMPSIPYPSLRMSMMFR